MKRKDEASTMGGGSVKGFQANAPKMTKKRLKASKPFDEVVALAESLDKEVEEVVKKKGSQWVFYDDETEVQHGAYADRETAWEAQRRQRKAKALKREKDRKSDPTKVQVDPKSVHKRARSQAKTTKEGVEAAKKVIRESFMTYMFEQAPESNSAALWEKFLERLSRETVMSDPKFKAILQKSIKAETEILKKAVEEIRKTLEATKSFKVKEKGLAQDGETKRIKNTFIVHMKDNNQDLAFSVVVENGRPLILFPDESKMAINQMANDESKLLRSELIHAQETILDEMGEVISSNDKRNKYLESLQSKVEGVLNDFNLLEIAMLKFLLKTKLKGIG